MPGGAAGDRRRGAGEGRAQAPRRRGGPPPPGGAPPPARAPPGPPPVQGERAQRPLQPPGDGQQVRDPRRPQGARRARGEAGRLQDPHGLLRTQPRAEAAVLRRERGQPVQTTGETVPWRSAPLVPGRLRPGDQRGGQLGEAVGEPPSERGRHRPGAHRRPPERGRAHPPHGRGQRTAGALRLLTAAAEGVHVETEPGVVAGEPVQQPVAPGHRLALRVRVSTLCEQCDAHSRTPWSPCP